MDALQEATGVLQAAEQQLKSILVKAVESGDYDHLSRIGEWAKLLGATLNGKPVPEIVPLPIANGVNEPAVASPRVARRAKSTRRKKTRKSSAATKGYPQFVREGDSLVKIGWSKRESKTYEHKAPRIVLKALVQALQKAGASGERFAVEVLLPLKDTATKIDIPDYQTYLTLAWLRSADLIIQHGRQGYSLPAKLDLAAESERKWNELTSR